jgi:hypothetical protein
VSLTVYLIRPTKWYERGVTLNNAVENLLHYFRMLCNGTGFIGSIRIYAIRMVKK